MERRYNPRRLRGVVVDDEYHESATFLPWGSVGTSRRAKVGNRTGKQRRQLAQPEFKSWANFPSPSLSVSFPSLHVSYLSHFYLFHLFLTLPVIARSLPKFPAPNTTTRSRERM